MPPEAAEIRAWVLKADNDRHTAQAALERSPPSPAPLPEHGVRQRPDPRPGVSRLNLCGLSPLGGEAS